MIVLGVILIVAACLLFALGRFRHADTVGVILLVLGALAIGIDLLSGASVDTD